eukprot:jgi/Mesen1/2070/ME000150S01148
MFLRTLFVLLALAITTVPADFVEDDSEGVSQQKTTSCTCYIIENRFCCGQSLCICKNICYNGQSLVSTEPQCKDASDVAPEGPIWPIKCSATFSARPGTSARTSKFRHWYTQAMGIESGFGLIEERSRPWMETRDKIEWRDGTTFILKLLSRDFNIAHFIGKVNQLLLVNNATVPALAGEVDRLLLWRDNRFVKSKAGEDGFHITLLRQLLILALRNVVGLDAIDRMVTPEGVMGLEPIAGERVEFEGAMDSASEEQPVCFQRAIIPGFLKERLVKVLGLDDEVESGSASGSEGSAGARPLRLLWLSRTGATTGGRRMLTPDSRDALKAMLGEFDMEVEEVEFGGLTFREQFRYIRRADIVLAVHGAALVNACSFARNSTVIVEIQPYHIYHHMYLTQAVNTGVTFLMHQNHQGPPQPQDEEFAGVGLAECMSFNTRCKEYFTHHRKVVLTRDDVDNLRQLVRLARHISRDAHQDPAAAGDRLAARFPELCVAEKRDNLCRSDVLRSPFADPQFECVLRQECPGFH